MIGKSILIPVAAFAVTATGVSAFNSDVLENAGLSNAEISAFEEAHELRKDGDREGARDVLLDAGIDQDTMERVREAMREHRQEHRAAIREAVENEDYDAFKDVVEGSPLADIITSENDFKQFVEAHELREEGNHEEAREIMEDLGFERKGPGHGHGKRGFGKGLKEANAN